MAKSISKDIKAQVNQIVNSFNEKHKTSFYITFRGQFAYLAKTEKQDSSFQDAIQILSEKMGIAIKDFPFQDSPTVETKIGRLKYNGQMDKWDFAVFRYSREFYDPDQFMFPGAEKLDGTIEGALMAGLEIYP